MKRFSTMLGLLFVLCFATVKGQNEKFKALFIYNFTNYIEWPNVEGNMFVIAVLGDSPIIAEIQTISKIKNVGRQTIEVKKINAVSEIGNASIIYVPNYRKKALLELAQTYGNKPVLVISDEAAGNFGINFVENGQKQSFQISRNNIEGHHLKVHSSLISLGTPVN